MLPTGEKTTLPLTFEDLIVRRNTFELEEHPELTVYDLFNWKNVDVKLVNYKTGEVLFNRENLEFPEDFSQNACDIIASKYFKQVNIPTELGYESSLKEVVHRMVNFWTLAALDEGLLTKKNKQIFYDEVAYLILAQKAAPNTPQWFNTGFKHAYNLDYPSDGNFYYDPKLGKVVTSPDAYTRTFASACFITSMEDSLLGEKSLSDQIITETRLFKQGSGIGINPSNIRAEGEHLSKGGTSSGVMSFLRVHDRNAGAIKSGGSTRRAAKLFTLDGDHPDILEYIDWKAHEEEKVKALGKMGYSTEFEGEAYETVSGQNANNSIRITNALMRKMIGDDLDPNWELKGRVDESINRIIDAKLIWNRWNYAAWRCGDPAPQFHDIINQWHTCPAGEDGIWGAIYNMIRAANPCSEYDFLDDTACNLASLNAAKFYDEFTGEFDVDGFRHATSLWQVVLEVSIHWGQYPTKDIARRSYLFRTTGIGIANTGYLNMIMAHPYDSVEARAISATLAGLLTGQAYLTSALMAQKVGAFDKYAINAKYMLDVIRNHAKVAGAVDGAYKGLTYKPLRINHVVLKKEGYSVLGDELKAVWQEVIHYGEAYGFRNAQVSVIAPTGTIGLAMDVGTTSTEPFFAHVVYKKLAGGGSMRFANPAIPLALRKLKYSEEEIKDILDYVVETEKIEGAPHLKEEHLPIFDTANKCADGIRYIAPMGHVLMVAAITPMISGAISKTVNLPYDATVEDFENVHAEAWRLGVKAIALYRDGCKESQPLNSRKAGDEDIPLEEMKYSELIELNKKLQHQIEIPERKRPSGIRDSRVHEASIEGLKLFVHVSVYQGKLSEVYISADKEGTTVKGTLDALSKMISKMLQYNIPYKDIAKSLRAQKYEPHGLVMGHPYIKFADSISDLISKIIEIETGDFSHCQVKPAKGEFIPLIHLKERLAQEDPLENNEPEGVSVKEPPHYAHSDEGTRIYGKTCANCGSSKMQKNGTCYVCMDCGNTTGCS